ncbi:MAG TPA: NHL repeat-containing protein [Planctomycetota bacterium]|nr:NHL repeat-containing protein [Planctomycetota bacterium]
MNCITTSALAILVSTTAIAQAPAFLVASRFTNQVLGYDAAGNFTGVFAAGGGLLNPVGITYGPDHNLYVVSANTNQVLRYAGSNGASLGVFISGLSAPRNLCFGPDGNLYVCNAGTNQVLRFDGSSGTALGVFAQGTAITANTSMTFGPDFNLYVGSVTNNQVVKFDGRTGALLSVFANTNMNGTHDMSFGPDRNLYVSNAFANNVVRFDGRTGAFLGVFVQDAALSAPLGIVWGSDGDLYLANQGGNEVRRYNGTTGSFVSVFVAPRAGGLSGPLFTTFVHDASGMQLGSPLPGPAGQDTRFVVTGAQPGCLLAIGLGTQAGSLPLPCPQITLGILDPAVLGTACADEGGRDVLRVFAPLQLQGLTFLFQAVDFTGCSASGVVTHTF